MNKQNSIHLRDALAIIDGFDLETKKPNQFNISWFTYDVRKGTGGKRIHARNCMRVVGKKNDKVIFPQAISSGKSQKNPNHFKHQTRNILVNGTNNIRKIHIRLIETINDKTVYW